MSWERLLTTYPARFGPYGWLVLSLLRAREQDGRASLPGPVADAAGIGRTKLWAELRRLKEAGMIQPLPFQPGEDRRYPVWALADPAELAEVFATRTLITSAPDGNKCSPHEHTGEKCSLSEQKCSPHEHISGPGPEMCSLSEQVPPEKCSLSEHTAGEVFTERTGPVPASCAGGLSTSPSTEDRKGRFASLRTSPSGSSLQEDSVPPSGGVTPETPLPEPPGPRNRVPPTNAAKLAGAEREAREAASREELDQTPGPRRDPRYCNNTSLQIGARKLCGDFVDAWKAAKPGCRAPVLQPMDRAAVRDALKAVAQADGLDYLQAEQDLRPMLQLLGREHTPLHKLKYRLQELRESHDRPTEPARGGAQPGHEPRSGGHGRRARSTEDLAAIEERLRARGIPG